MIKKSILIILITALIAGCGVFKNKNDLKKSPCAKVKVEETKTNV